MAFVSGASWVLRSLMSALDKLKDAYKLAKEIGNLDLQLLMAELQQEVQDLLEENRALPHATTNGSWFSNSTSFCFRPLSAVAFHSFPEAPTCTAKSPRFLWMCATRIFGADRCNGQRCWQNGYTMSQRFSKIC
jgi:hypothetical protein